MGFVSDTGGGGGGVGGTSLEPIVEEATLDSVFSAGGSLDAAVVVSDVGSFAGVGSFIEGFLSSAKHLWS